jgi:hypothetical protein
VQLSPAVSTAPLASVGSNGFFAVSSAAFFGPGANHRDGRKQRLALPRPVQCGLADFPSLAGFALRGSFGLFQLSKGNKEKKVSLGRRRNVVHKSAAPMNLLRRLVLENGGRIGNGLFFGYGWPAYTTA